MTPFVDSPDRYGLVSRILHWGMALLFLAQFVSAAAHWGLPPENAIRDFAWSYHQSLGMTLFLLVLMRGIWGLANRQRRPLHEGTLGRAAVVGHLALYTLMIIVPAVRILSSIGSTRGLSYFGLRIIAPRTEEVAWMQAPSEWHGEMGWILALLIVGHAGMAMVWHRLIKRDDVLARMTN